ncbi:MAG: DUF6491 family protein [Steroidobacteraceae bacterium]
MSYRSLKWILAPAMLAALTACAGMAQRRAAADQQERARYLAYAGAPVDHFTWFGRYDGWQALSDSELVVFMGANGAYLLKVWSPCGTRGLPFINRIGLTHSFGGTVYARLDSVRADRWNCPISEIRPIDLKRMRQDARAAAHR